ncbi:MAG: hypothetical protein V8R80_11650 [Eubacterium sp.]
MKKTLFYHGKIYTMQVTGRAADYLPETADEIKMVQSMLVEDGKILRIGCDETLLAEVDAQTEKID